MTQLVWFRSDLRVADNPALHEACASGQPVAALFRNFNSVLNGAYVCIQPGLLYFSYAKTSKYFSDAFLAFALDLHHYSFQDNCSLHFGNFLDWDCWLHIGDSAETVRSQRSCDSGYLETGLFDFGERSRSASLSCCVDFGP